jgi:Spy/CpxP family protein refolding chaperone
MKLSPVMILAIILMTGLGGGIGGWIGVQYGLRAAHSDQGLDEVVHHQLGLTTDQNARIEVMEQDFAGRRKGFEAEMEAANRDLAQALASQHAYGPDAQHAIERFHGAMGGLQEATIQHILAMRGVLTPDQAAKFDTTISQALAPARK